MPEYKWLPATSLERPAQILVSELLPWHEINKNTLIQLHPSPPAHFFQVLWVPTLLPRRPSLLGNFVLQKVAQPLPALVAPAEFFFSYFLDL